MDQNSPNLWDAFLAALKTVCYIKGGADAAEAEEQLALLTLDEQLEQEAEADIESRPPNVCNFVLATQPESSSSDEDEATRDILPRIQLSPVPLAGYQRMLREPSKRAKR